jgi:hypothetical protein
MEMCREWPGKGVGRIRCCIVARWLSPDDFEDLSTLAKSDRWWVRAQHTLPSTKNSAGFGTAANTTPFTLSLICWDSHHTYLETIRPRSEQYHRLEEACSPSSRLLYHRRGKGRRKAYSPPGPRQFRKLVTKQNSERTLRAAFFRNISRMSILEDIRMPWH